MFGKDENSNLKRYVHPNVCSHTIYNSQNMEAMHTVCICTHTMEYYPTCCSTGLHHKQLVEIKPVWTLKKKKKFKMV